MQSCNISLNGRESMPPFSSTLGRGQSADGLLGTPLIWEHLASWSMSFANFRERFLTEKKKNKNYYVAYSEQYLQSCWSMLGVSWKKIPCDSHYFLILVWKFWNLLSKLLNGSILCVAVVRFDENHCFRMCFFFLQLKFNLHTITICLHLFNPFKILKAKRKKFHVGIFWK